mgnify:CR=1 FL=1
MPRFDTPLHTNDQSIDRVLNSGLPVVLVIWRGSLDGSLEESLRQIARNDAGRLLVARLDADANPQTAARLVAPASGGRLQPGRQPPLRGGRPQRDRGP